MATEGVVGPELGGVVAKVVEVAAAREVRNRTTAGVAARGLADTKATRPSTEGETEPDKRVAVVPRGGQQGRPARTRQVRSTKEIETLPEVPVVKSSTAARAADEGAVQALRVPRPAEEAVEPLEAVMARALEATVGRGRDRQDVPVPDATIAAAGVAVEGLVPAPGPTAPEVTTPQVGAMPIGLQGADAALVEVGQEVAPETAAGDVLAVRTVVAGPARGQTPAGEEAAMSRTEGGLAASIVGAAPEPRVQAGPIRAVPAPPVGLAAARSKRIAAVPVAVEGEAGTHAAGAAAVAVGVRIAQTMTVGPAPREVGRAVFPATPLLPAGGHAQAVGAVVSAANAPLVRLPLEFSILRPPVIGRRPQAEAGPPKASTAPGASTWVRSSPPFYHLQ